jgi:superfamily II DNA helicase RecQ
MRELGGHDAFEALARLLGGEEQLPWYSREPAFDRLRIALGETEPFASPIDLSVLLRQTLRYEYARRGYEVSPQIWVSDERLRSFQDWDLVGLSVTRGANRLRIAATEWRPEWLNNPLAHGIDDEASSEHTQRVFGAEGCEGDLFLRVIGRSSYRSSGQRAAVRAALATPPGATLVVALPTGEGKSMIFQLIQAVGFVGEDSSAGQGVTLVIVPTVALAVNHESEAVDVCKLPKPLAFQGGAEAANSLIAERISLGVQGLCFASPEAACGRLRPALREAAQSGLLRAMVIDEAHLVDQWGTGFRTEFQELSGLRRELIALAPERKELRTILLSATLTDSSLETLRALFAGEGGFESCAAVRLRPEPDYWVARQNETEREGRVLEALHHIPRPAVLYVTEVEEAETWHRRLYQAGFRRLAMLHGSTSRDARERVVRQWRDGALDIVVGTSAFGLGIDFAHARSVVHACVPETLDRFYQEVGRGGRDGRSSLSLIVPTRSDIRTAKGINQQQIITVDRGFERWKALFEGKRSLAAGQIAVRVDGSPGASDRDIDMKGDQNTDWNLRTLALMARAGVIRLHGAPHPAIAEIGDWFALEILDDAHLQREHWRREIEPVRNQSHIASARNLELMQQFLKDEGCPANILESLYGTGRVSKVCSRCSICRVDPLARQPARSIGEPRGPWELPLHPLLSRLLGSDGRLLVTYRRDHAGVTESRRLGDSIGRLQRAALAKLILIGKSPFNMDRVLRVAETKPLFVASLPSLAHSRLPDGPEMVIFGVNQEILQASLDPYAGRSRILLVPEDQTTPQKRKLRDIFGGRVLTLEEFNERVAL